MSQILEIRFEPGEQLPDAHSTIFTRGMAGTYRIRIHAIVGSRQHPDGATLLKVKATRTLMEPKEGQ